jgi:hypothetical protein
MQGLYGIPIASGLRDEICIGIESAIFAAQKFLALVIFYALFARVLHLLVAQKIAYSSTKYRAC